MSKPWKRQRRRARREAQARREREAREAEGADSNTFASSFPPDSWWDEPEEYSEIEDEED